MSACTVLTVTVTVAAAQLALQDIAGHCRTLHSSYVLTAVSLVGVACVVRNYPVLQVNLQIPAGGAALCCHLMPARRTCEWKVDVVFV